MGRPAMIKSKSKAPPRQTMAEWGTHGNPHLSKRSMPCPRHSELLPIFCQPAAAGWAKLCRPWRDGGCGLGNGVGVWKLCNPAFNMSEGGYRSYSGRRFVPCPGHSEFFLTLPSAEALGFLLLRPRRVGAVLVAVPTEGRSVQSADGFVRSSMRTKSPTPPNDGGMGHPRQSAFEIFPQR